MAISQSREIRPICLATVVTQSPSLRYAVALAHRHRREYCARGSDALSGTTAGAIRFDSGRSHGIPAATERVQIGSTYATLLFSPDECGLAHRHAAVPAGRADGHLDADPLSEGTGTATLVHICGESSRGMVRRNYRVCVTVCREGEV